MESTAPPGGITGERSVAEMAGVMLVEDHELFRRALAVILDNEPGLRVVAQAGSLAEARERAAVTVDRISVAVVDFTLPDGDALDLIADLRSSVPGVKILVLTASIELETIDRAYEAGANAALHKSAGKDEILAAIKALV